MPRSGKKLFASRCPTESDRREDIESALAAGTILVATPGVSTPELAEAVILVLSHDEEGTMGINIAGRRLAAGLYSGGILDEDDPQTILVYEREKGFITSSPIGHTGYAFTQLFNHVDMEAEYPTFAKLDARKKLMVTGCVSWEPKELAGDILAGLWRPIDPALKLRLGVFLEQDRNVRWMHAAGIAGVLPPAPPAEEKSVDDRPPPRRYTAG